MSINKEKLIRYRTSESFEMFVRYFFKERNGRKFVLNDHHHQIIEALEKVIKGETTRLIINIAPRYSKTEIAVKNLIAYCLALNAAAKFIHLSYSDTLALDNSEEIKDFISSAEFQAVFDVQIKADSNAKKKWYTTEGGGVYATSAGGQVTGFGAGKVEEETEESELDDFMTFIENAKGFGGAIIIDDPIKPDDADSNTVREKINNRFDSTIRSRVNSRNTPIIIVMQRLHPLDLSGYLLDIEPEEWTVLSLPVIKEDGCALWPFKHTLEELKKLEAANESVFKRQYMQNPEPTEGLMFPKEELNFFKEDQIDLKQSESQNAFNDIADAGKDFLSMPFGALLPDDNRIFIHDVVFTQDGTDTNVSMCVERINKHNAEFVQIESNFGGGMYIQLMNASTDPAMNGFTSLIPMNSRANKHTRIQTMSGFIKKYFYFKDDFDKTSEYGKFMNQLILYTKTGKGVKNDDAPDSLSGLARMILTYFPDLWDVVYQEQAESSG
jgi:hypothetical protein